ncbi:hypothetical protein ACJX0J_024298, partial [Zea mays]
GLWYSIGELNNTSGGVRLLGVRAPQRSFLPQHVMFKRIRNTDGNIHEIIMDVDIGA